MSIRLPLGPFVSDPLSLARMRALRTVTVPVDRVQLSAIEAAARLAARNILDVVGDDGIRGLLLGWEPGYDAGSIFGSDNDVVREEPASVLLTLAACIRCCWPDPSESLYPGHTSTEAEILNVLDKLSVAITPSASSQVANRRIRKGALRRLRACGLLATDGTDGTVRLGPLFATWPDGDVGVLRSRYGDLPGIDSVAE